MGDIFNPAALTNDFYKDRATIDNIVSTTNLNNSNTAINQENLREAQSLFPAKMEAASLENQKTQAQIFGINAATDLDRAQKTKVDLANDGARIELRYADEKARLVNAGLDVSNREKEAQIRLFAAQTKSQLADVDTKTQKLIEGQNVMLSQGLSTIKTLAASGDEQGANAAYQALLKSLHPALLKFEAPLFQKIGPEINSKKNPNVVSALDDGAKYAGYLIDPDSFSGKMQLEAQKIQGQKDVASIQAGAKGAGSDPQKAAAQAEDATDKLIRPRVYQLLSKTDYNFAEKDGNWFLNGAPVNSQGPVQQGIDAIQTTAKEVYKNSAYGGGAKNSVNITDQLSGNYKVGDLVVGKGTFGNDTVTAIIPNDDKEKASLEAAIQKLVTDKGYSVDQAYQFLMKGHTQIKARQILMGRKKK